MYFPRIFKHEASNYICKETALKQIVMLLNEVRGWLLTVVQDGWTLFLLESKWGPSQSVFIVRHHRYFCPSQML